MMGITCSTETERTESPPPCWCASFPIPRHNRPPMLPDLASLATPAAALAATLAVGYMLAPRGIPGKPHLCPHCDAPDTRPLTPDLRRCNRCYGRFPEPG